MTITPTLQAPPFPGVIKKPQQGEAVKKWQQRMQDRGWHIKVDGIYGTESERLCKNFQAEKHLQVTGVVDETTWDKTWTAPSAVAPPFPGRVLKQPPIMNGEDVRQWQDEINKRGWPLMVDGSYGPKSEEICRQFQKEHALVVDGRVGRNTWTNTWVETI
ncbi:peptidoglycan-binding protein [Nonomuraea sp. NPDC050022]|uniref:peptidoglycan-binding domain-containing protein n=1 Tax=unclassified Nonomuraea TaxID=2593643 RepID=UPI0033D2CEA3